MMVYIGRPGEIRSSDLVEMTLNVGFDISITKAVRIIRRNMSTSGSGYTNKEFENAAKHCLVVLIGGKRVFVEVPACNSVGRVIDALVFLPVPVEDAQHEVANQFGLITPAAGMTNGFLPPYLFNVNTAMDVLYERNYDVEFAKQFRKWR